MKIDFEGAIGDAPPSTVDVDRLIERRRRIGRLQWAGRAGLAVVALVAAGAVTLVVRDDGPAPTVAASASATAPANPEDETVEQRGARYAAVLPVILAERLPGVTATGTFTFRVEAATAGTGARGAGARSETRYTWTGTVTGPAGTAKLTVLISDRLIGATKEIIDNIDRHRCGSEGCVAVTGPNGEKIQPDGNGSKVLHASVGATLADRTSVTAGFEPAGSSEPVVTIDQLVAIANDNRFAW